MRNCLSPQICTACCLTRAVPELAKPPGQPCEHQTSSGCSIYDTRPPSCQRFSCLWRDGWGFSEDQPAQTGMVLLCASPLFPEVLYQAWESLPGALQTPQLRNRLEELSLEVGILEISLEQAQAMTGPLDRIRTILQSATVQDKSAILAQAKLVKK